MDNYYLKHRKEILHKRKEDYYYYKNHGICVHCHQNNAEKNKCLCLVCSSKSNEARLNRYYKNHEENKNKNRKKTLDRYYKLKSEGICVSCGKRKASNNIARCPICSKKEAYKKRQKYLLKTYKTRNMNEIRV